MEFTQIYPAAQLLAYTGVQASDGISAVVAAGGRDAVPPRLFALLHCCAIRSKSAGRWTWEIRRTQVKFLWCSRMHSLDGLWWSTCRRIVNCRTSERVISEIIISKRLPKTIHKFTETPWPIKNLRTVSLNLGLAKKLMMFFARLLGMLTLFSPPELEKKHIWKNNDDVASSTVKTVELTRKEISLSQLAA